MVRREGLVQPSPDERRCQILAGHLEQGEFKEVWIRVECATFDETDQKRLSDAGLGIVSPVPFPSCRRRQTPDGPRSEETDVEQ
jgi:hypothetical protein